MSLPAKAIVLVALFAWLPAEAQFLGPGFESDIEPTKHDLEIIHRTVAQLVRRKPVGASASWSNPDSGNFGTIKLLRRDARAGRICGTAEYTLARRRMAVAPEHYM
jgi:hypothetical protein